MQMNGHDSLCVVNNRSRLMRRNTYPTNPIITPGTRICHSLLELHNPLNVCLGESGEGVTGIPFQTHLVTATCTFMSEHP